MKDLVKSEIKQNLNNLREEKPTYSLKRRLLSTNSNQVLNTEANEPQANFLFVKSFLNSNGNTKQFGIDNNNPNNSNIFKASNISSLNNYMNVSNISSIGRNNQNNSINLNSNQFNKSLMNNSNIHNQKYTTNTTNYNSNYQNSIGGSNIENSVNITDTNFKHKVLKNLKSSNFNAVKCSNRLVESGNHSNSNLSSSKKELSENNSNSRNQQNLRNLTSNSLYSKTYMVNNPNNDVKDLNSNINNLINNNKSLNSIIDRPLSKGKQLHEKTHSIQSNLNHKNNQESVFNNYLNSDIPGLNNHHNISSQSKPKDKGNYINSTNFNSVNVNNTATQGANISNQSPGLFSSDHSYIPMKHSRNNTTQINRPQTNPTHSINLFNNHTYISPNPVPNVNVNVSHIRIDVNEGKFSSPDYRNLHNISNLSHLSSLTQNNNYVKSPYTNNFTQEDCNNTNLTQSQTHTQTLTQSQIRDDNRHLQQSSLSNNFSNSTNVNAFKSTKTDKFNYSKDQELSHKSHKSNSNNKIKETQSSNEDNSTLEFLKEKQFFVTNINNSVNQNSTNMNDDNNIEQTYEEKYTTTKMIDLIENFSKLKKIFDETIVTTSSKKNLMLENNLLMQTRSQEAEHHINKEKEKNDLFFSLLKNLNFTMNDHFHKVVENYNYMRERVDNLCDDEKSKQ
jgi:hypothetical protein